MSAKLERLYILVGDPRIIGAMSDLGLNSLQELATKKVIEAERSRVEDIRNDNPQFDPRSEVANKVAGQETSRRG